MTRRAASSPGQLYEQTVAKRSVPLPGVPAPHRRRDQQPSALSPRSSIPGMAGAVRINFLQVILCLPEVLAVN
jgi:hypothetical protein